MSEFLARRAAFALEHDPGQHAVQVAASALGWAGIVLPETELFGIRLHPVVVPDLEAHRSREHTGDGPELDSDTLTVWEWPESSSPAPAVLLEGALMSVARRGFRRALGDARRWRGFGPAAVLVPATVVADAVTEELWRWDCALHGIGLTSDEPTATIVVAPEAGRLASARRRTADRWIEETLYAVALDAGLFGSAPAVQGS